jgi:localization factor PodJL
VAPAAAALPPVDLAPAKPAVPAASDILAPPVRQQPVAFVMPRPKPAPPPKARPVDPLLAKARGGDMQAQHELALAYAGRGEHKRAAAWFREAAIAGLPEARFQLGQQYRAGRGIAANPLEAFIWTRSAAEQGLPQAQLAIGEAFERGLGVPAAPVEAYAWYALAAEAGVGAAEARREALLQSFTAAERSAAEARAASLAASLVASTGPNRHLVAEIQRLLRMQGYDAGLDDGFRGGRTVEAIRRYQHDKGLAVDGNPTEELLVSLRRAVRPPPPTVE